MKSDAVFLLVFGVLQIGFIQAQPTQLEVDGPDQANAMAVKIRTTYQGIEEAYGMEARATSNSFGTAGNFIGSFRAINAYSSGGNAIEASAAQSYAVRAASATFPAGYFLCENKLWPDLIIGGTGNNNPGDDCRIGSDPNYVGSDLFLRTNDAIVFELDYNNDEEGQFEIRNSNANVIFKVDEVGKSQLNGAQSVAELNSNNTVSGSVLVLDNSTPSPFNDVGAINFRTFAATPGQIAYSSSNTMNFRVNNINPLMQLSNGANHITMSNGAKLTAGGMWMDVSTKLRKDLQGLVDQDQILNRILMLPIYHWNYKSESGFMHIGPTAEDFHDLFGYGPDNVSLSPSDLAGSAIAAVQTLHRQNTKLKSEVEELKTQLNFLCDHISKKAKRRIAKLEKP
ncbi:MAG: hypothetical protein HKN76_08325 [Saprospiraceae bacterium]|nr:hypothetical protein [Saprospiraceae bacterium]